MSGFAVAAVCAAMVQAGPASAATHPKAGACDAWKKAKDGNWNAAANWSSGVPDSTTPVCITVAGKYTVSVTDYEQAASLSLGAAGASQPTLLLAPKGVSSAYLQVGGDITNAGATVSTSSTGSGSSSQATLNWAGTFTNTGVLSTSAGTAKTTSYLEGDLVNTGAGSVSIAGPTSYDLSATEFDNAAPFTVTSKGSFQTNAQNEFVDQSGGTIANAGSFTVAGESLFTLSGGSETGTPLVVDDSTVSDRGTAAAGFMFTDGGTFLGNVASGQSLTVASVTDTSSSFVTVPQSFSNAGTITVTSIGSTHGAAEDSGLQWSGMLTNTGTILVSDGPVPSYRYLSGNLDNTGAIEIAGNKAYFSQSGTLLTNAGTLTIDNGAILTVQQAQLVNSSGTITSKGTLVADDATIEQGGGTTTGNPVTLTDDSALSLTGTGAGSFLFSQPGTMVGDVAAAQSVTIAGVTATNDTYVTEPSSFTNAGTITLTSQGAASGNAQDAELDWKGRLTNTGTITAAKGASGGTRILDGNFLTNSGTVNATVTLEDDTDNAKWTNSGTVSIAAAKTLSLPNDGNYRQTSAGTLAVGVAGTTVGVVLPSKTAALDGAISATGTATSGHVYTVVGPTTTLTGSFATVAPGYTASYSPTTAKLTAN